MILVDQKVKPGDRVYVWTSSAPQKASKHPEEREFTLEESVPGKKLSLKSDSGYVVIYGKELIESWYGNVRKA